MGWVRTTVSPAEPYGVIVTVGAHFLVVIAQGTTVLLVAKDRVADLQRPLADGLLPSGTTTGASGS